MKSIKTMEEYKQINGKEPSIVKFGLPNCIPCKMTQENLEEFEKDNKFNLTYYECGDINMMAELGYEAVPVVVLITPQKIVELKDSSISMDSDELANWIEQNIKG